MIWPFKSKRNWWRDEARKLLDVYVDCLKGMDGPEIGSALDMAKRLKDSMLEKIPAQDTYTPLAFSEPRAISEQLSLSYLAEWHKKMQPTLTQSTMDFAAVGAFAIWWLSLAAGTFAELRFRSREMWSHLARGFQYCETFNPELDIPR